MASYAVAHVIWEPHCGQCDCISSIAGGLTIKLKWFAPDTQLYVAEPGLETKSQLQNLSSAPAHYAQPPLPAMTSPCPTQT